MFAQETPNHTHSLRPKRNRQAAGNEENLPTAKRKRRSVLRHNTFEPLAEASINEVVRRDSAEAQVNGHADASNVVPSSSKSKDLTIRSTKLERRSDRTQPATILATNDFYSVSELPSLPHQVRDYDKTGKAYSCTFSIEHGYALAITHTEAVIWPYTSSASTPSSRDVIVVPIALLHTSDSDPLPLATFTKASVEGEPGLLVVSSKWGKVIYWDTLTNASTTLPGQETSGVQGSIPNLNGETIEELVNAEPAGFIVSMSRGRVAHVSVRDQKGRPSIGVQNLNKVPSTGFIGAIGGSVRKMVGWSHRRGIPLIKAGAARKGQRDVLIMTENGDLEVWETNITVGNHSKLQRSMLEDTRRALQPYVHAEKVIHQYDLKVLDFDLAPSGTEVARRDESNHVSLVALVALSDSISTQLFMIEMLIKDSASDLVALHAITCFSPKELESSKWRPRLSIVKTTAFAVFETAVVLYSLSRISESPSSQLMSEGHALPSPFQDVIQLDGDKAYRFLGCTTDEDAKDALCLLAVSLKGLIRIQSHKNEARVDADVYANKISAKSRIEQAIFYGSNKENPLDLNTATATSFSQEDVEEAALQISHEIITAESKSLPRNSTSIAKHLSDRAKYLDALIYHLRKYYSKICSEEMRDKLLWNAEKVAAAQAAWKTQESIQRRYPREDRELSHMEFALRALPEEQQNAPDEDKGQNDRVRHFLLNNIENMHELLVQVVDCLRELPDFDITDPKDIGELIVEAVDIWSASYAAAFKFREDHATWYGFGDRSLDRGVFADGYTMEAGRPWTSQGWPTKCAKRLLEYVANYLGEWKDYNPSTATAQKKKMPVNSDGKEHGAPPRALVTELTSRLPKQVDLLIRVVTEEIIWAANEEAVTQGSHEAETVLDIKADKQPRIAKVVETMAVFDIEGAIAIAERLHDPYLLVDLTYDHLGSLKSEQLTYEKTAQPLLAEKCSKKIEEVQDRAETYYEKFGVRWALANSSRKVANGNLGTLLSEAQDNKGQKQSFLNTFLKRAKKAGQPVGKIAWINDIRGDGNYQRAERTLLKVASEEETDIWAQRTELCLAKLAGLAALEERAAPEPISIVNDKYDNKLALVEIQDRISQHISNIVGRTIDNKATEDVATAELSNQIVSKSPGFKHLLRNSICALINRQPLSPDGLIDFLTLADPYAYEQEPETDPEIFGEEFPLALKIVDICDLPKVHKIALRQIIWRRAMIRDDWTILNKTANKSDEDVQETMQRSTLFKTILPIYFEAAHQDHSNLEGAQPVDPVSNIFSPSQILEESPFPVVLQEQFKGAEKEIEAVKKDFEKEQATLRKYVEKAQLELHFNGLSENARDAVNEQLRIEVEEQEAKEAAAAAEAEAEAEEMNGVVNGDAD